MKHRFLNIALKAIAVAALALALFVISQSSYLLFHALVEMFSITIAISVFVLTWNSRSYLQNGYLVFVGTAGLFSGAIDLLHTLSFEGMGIFPSPGPNLATQLWLAARYIQSVSFVLAPLFLSRRVRDGWMLAGLTVFTAALLALIFGGSFPIAYVTGRGLTYFKIYSEYVIMTVYTFGLILLVANRRQFDRGVLVMLAWSIALAVFAEFAFTFYVDVTGLINMAGHFLKVGSYYLLYNAIIEKGVKQPYRTIFRDLKASEEQLRSAQAHLETQVEERTQELRLANAGLLNEINEREKAERAMEEQSHLLETVVTQAANGIIIRNAKGKVTFINPAARRFLGLDLKPGEEVDLESFLTIYTADGTLLPIQDWPMATALRGQASEGLELRLVQPGGDYHDVIAGATPLFRPDSSINGAVLVLADITQRRQAEQALREAYQEMENRVNQRTNELREINARLERELQERVSINRALRASESRLRRLVESNIIGVMFTTEAGDIVNGNDAFLAMIGYTRKDLLSGAIRWRELTPPEFVARDENGIAEAREKGSCTPYEKEYIRKDGSRVPILIGYAALEDSSGEYVCYVVDLTRQKQAEAAIQHYAQQLERSNRELQDFAYVASHDLQEPLRKIMAFGDRLSTSAAGKLNGQEQDYLQRMNSATGRMRDMINDLLTLSRVTTQAQPFGEVNLNKVARDVVSDLEVRIEQSGASVQVGELPTIQADELQMHQLLQNLVANALKFNRPGKPPEVRVNAALENHDSHGQQVRISVSDNGIGFDEQYTDRIFQPFQRLHGRGEYEGSGMGLAIVQKIVQRHNGSVTVRSRPGEGSTFVVSLPVKASENGR